jgi:cytochrome c biogenesis protein CcdA
MFQDLFRLHEWKLIFQALAEYPDVVPYVIEFCFILLSYLILFIATLYLSMSIGHLFPKHRVLLSVVAYFVLQTLGRTVVMLVGNLLGTNGTWFDFQLFFTNAHAQLWGLIGLALLGSALCFAAVNWILGHKLNLE